MRKDTYKNIVELKDKYNLSYRYANGLYRVLKKVKYNPLKPINFMEIRNIAKKNYLGFNELINSYKKWLDEKAQELNKKALYGVIVKRAKSTNRLITNDLYFIDDLEAIHDLLKCDLIDIQERQINNKVYDFIFDDEMLLKEQTFNKIVASDTTNNEIFFRRLLIVGVADNNGAETTLTDSDISNIIKSRKMIMTETGEHLEVLNYNF